jgi:hypothetical protein
MKTTIKGDMKTKAYLFINRDAQAVSDFMSQNRKGTGVPPSG